VFTAVSLGTHVIPLEDVQCQLNVSNASHLIVTLVVGSQCSLSLDVFIAIVKLANALLHQGNTQVQVYTCYNLLAYASLVVLLCLPHQETFLQELCKPEAEKFFNWLHSHIEDAKAELRNSHVLQLNDQTNFNDKGLMEKSVQVLRS